MSKRVKEILSWYSSDSPGTLANLARMLNHGRLGGTGKLVILPVEIETAAVVWGEPGTSSQHSFFQLIHQGTDIIPVDFLLAAAPSDGIGGHHPQLAANAFAQSAALAFGKEENAVRAEPTRWSVAVIRHPR
jgi:glucose-6-phosphate isomerase